MAVAREQEMKAAVQELRAKVVVAESEGPRDGGGFKEGRSWA